MFIIVYKIIDIISKGSIVIMYVNDIVSSVVVVLKECFWKIVCDWYMFDFFLLFFLYILFWICWIFSRIEKFLIRIIKKGKLNISVNMYLYMCKFK